MNVIWFDYALPCICSFLACLGFTLVFNIHGVGKLICGVGGALGWLVYLLAGKTIFAAFLASAVIGLYADRLAVSGGLSLPAPPQRTGLSWRREAYFPQSSANLIPSR